MQAGVYVMGVVGDEGGVSQGRSVNIIQMGELMEKEEFQRTWISREAPGSTMPVLGRTQYSFGAVVFHLNATRSMPWFVRLPASKTGIGS